MGARLDPLDPKKLGKDAEMQDIEVGQRNKCDHFFEMRRSDEIKCIKCNTGLFIGLGDKVENGHLYHNDKLII